MWAVMSTSYGTQAKNLLHELQRSEWLPPYNVRGYQPWVWQRAG